MFVPGTFGGNSYGDDPLEEAYITNTDGMD
jgi:hypothetical protein